MNMTRKGFLASLLAAFVARKLPTAAAPATGGPLPPRLTRVTTSSNATSEVFYWNVEREDGRTSKWWFRYTADATEQLIDGEWVRLGA